DKEEVGQTVEIASHLFVGLLLAAKGDNAPFRPTHQYPGDMKRRRDGASAGQHETANLRSFSIVPVDPLLQPLHHLFRYPVRPLFARLGQIRTGIKQFMLNLRQIADHIYVVVWSQARNRLTDEGVRLLDGSVGRHPNSVLEDRAAVDSRFSLVTGSRVDAHPVRL